MRQPLPTALNRQLETLGAIMLGAMHRMSRQMARIARAMPLDTTQSAKEQRLRRFLDNERTTQTDHDHPIVQQAWHRLNDQRVHRIRDRVLLRDHHTILVISVGFRRRSLPFAWRALLHRGARGVPEQHGMIPAAVARLN